MLLLKFLQHHWSPAERLVFHPLGETGKKEPVAGLNIFRPVNSL